MGNTVIRLAPSIQRTYIDPRMISHKMWSNCPKLFHLWIYLHSTSDTSYGAMAKAMGCSISSIKQNIAKLKHVGDSYGIVVFNTTNINRKGNKTDVIYNIYESGRQMDSAIIEHNIQEHEIKDDVMNSYLTLNAMDDIVLTVGEKEEIKRWFEECAELNEKETLKDLPF